MNIHPLEQSFHSAPLTHPTPKLGDRTVAFELSVVFVDGSGI
jgi:hypothetical protein